MESLWLSGRALEHKIWRVWGLIPQGDSEFYLCPTLVTRWKTSLFNVLFIVKFERFKDNWSVSLSPQIQLSLLHLWDFLWGTYQNWVQDLNQKCLNYMYSFLLFCKCIQTYVEFGLRVLHYGYITEILRTVPAALHLQSQWKDDVLVFK